MGSTCKKMKEFCILFFLGGGALNAKVLFLVKLEQVNASSFCLIPQNHKFLQLLTVNSSHPTLQLPSISDESTAHNHKRLRAKAKSSASLVVDNSLQSQCHHRSALHQAVLVASAFLWKISELLQPSPMSPKMSFYTWNLSCFKPVVS